MYQVKYLRYWSNNYEPEVDTYFFESKENAEKLVEAFKKHYGNEVADTHNGGCIYPLEPDSISRRIIRIGKVETNDENIDKMCSQVKILGTIL